MTPEIEALRLEVAALKAASREAAAVLDAAERRLAEKEREAKKAAAAASKPDAALIGGWWFAELRREGPRKVTGLVLTFGHYGWRWDWRRQTLIPMMNTDEDRAALLAAAGEWHK